MKEKKLVLVWLLSGVFLRLIFMPFTMHPDILHIYYHPFFLAYKGVWNIYNYHADFFRAHRYFYYSPLTYLFFGAYLYFIKPFLSGFDFFMEKVRYVTDFGGGHSAHYLTEIQGRGLFRFLFLMKLPYLFFDAGLLALMIKSSRFCADAKRSRLTLWWALNPLLIYTSYLLGQFDIIPVFFIFLASYFALKQENNLSMVSLGIGSAFKGFPLFLIFPFSFFFGRNIKGTIRYAFAGLLPLFIIVGPYYMLCGSKVLGTFLSGRIINRLGFSDPYGPVRLFIFIPIYLVFCASLFKKSIRDKLGRAWPFKISLLTLALLFFTFSISFHYFLWLTPFILLLGAHSGSKITGIYLISIILLGITTLAGKGVCGGLFSPIYPQFFMGLPGLDEIIKKFLPYTLMRGLSSFAFAVSMVLIMIMALLEKRNEKGI